MSFMKLTASAVALAAVTATAAAARDEIRIVGSSTVFPYTQAVAEQFANTTGAPSPQMRQLISPPGIGVRRCTARASRSR